MVADLERMFVRGWTRHGVFKSVVFKEWLQVKERRANPEAGRRPKHFHGGDPDTQLKPSASRAQEMQKPTTSEKSKSSRCQSGRRWKDRWCPVGWPRGYSRSPAALVAAAADPPSVPGAPSHCLKRCPRECSGLLPSCLGAGSVCASLAEPAGPRL